jgi:hypothetical protein
MAFAVGDKVLVLHFGNLYDAKILETKQDKYFIHYQGWKDRWDEVIFSQKYGIIIFYLKKLKNKNKIKNNDSNNQRKLIYSLFLVG